MRKESPFNWKLLIDSQSFWLCWLGLWEDHRWNMDHDWLRARLWLKCLQTGSFLRLPVVLPGTQTQAEILQPEYMLVMSVGSTFVGRRGREEAEEDRETNSLDLLGKSRAGIIFRFAFTRLTWLSSYTMLSINHLNHSASMEGYDRSTGHLCSYWRGS